MQPANLNVFQINSLSHELETQLANSFVVREVKQNQYLLRVGEIPRHLYLIQEGSFFVYHGEAGKEKVDEYKLAGSALGNFDKFICQEPSEESIICFQKSILFVISYESIRTILDADPKFEAYLRQVWDEADKAPDDPPVIESPKKQGRLTESFLVGHLSNLGKRVYAYFVLPK